MKTVPTSTVWTYTMEVIGPTHPTSYPLGKGLANWEARIDPEILREAEENISDLLPKGYSVRFTDWDAERDE